AHPRRGESRDRIERTGQFGGDGDLGQRPIGGGEDRLDRLGGGCREHPGGVRTLEIRGQERALRVQADDLGTVTDELGAGGQRPSIVSETYDSASARVPCRRCTARIVSSPARPSSALAPPAPWQWMSTKAGARYPPAPSMTSTLAEAARSFQPCPRPRAMTVS